MSVPRGRALMLQGTASSVGKSLLTTALCRIFHQDGYKVAPFKAQNMSNNSYVTPDGREIGRAQAVQAAAAGIEPRAEMNPILLKPEADHRSQVVVLGRPAGVIRGADFIQRKRELWPVVASSLDTLLNEYELVIVEGAGSPAEINLRAGDIVNMKVARYAACPVLLVGDIDRGGVFAHLIGTLQLLEPAERSLVRGLVINKFRGSVELLRPGLDWLVEYSGLPVCGVVPWLDAVGVADEDAVALEVKNEAPASAIDVAVLELPHIANFDDFDPLKVEADTRVRFVTGRRELGRPELVIIPGTKATLADLAWLRERGLDHAVLDHARAGGAVIGICGGYQMLGRRIFDPEHVESSDGSAEGLGLLDVVTVFGRTKATVRVSATVEHDAGLLSGLRGEIIRGYEIHMGQTVAGRSPFQITDRAGSACSSADGAIDDSGRVLGTYLHGLFDNDGLRGGLLRNLGRSDAGGPALAWDRERAYDRLADHVRAALDMEAIRALVGLT